MNAELEAILKSYDAFREARRPGAQAEDLYAIYDSRLDDVLQRCPGLSKETLQRLVDAAYGPWRRAQNKPSAMPPHA
jgi:hypothetical protein